MFLSFRTDHMEQLSLNHRLVIYSPEAGRLTYHLPLAQSRDMESHNHLNHARVCGRTRCMWRGQHMPCHRKYCTALPQHAAAQCSGQLVVSLPAPPLSARAALRPQASPSSGSGSPSAPAPPRGWAPSAGPRTAAASPSSAPQLRRAPPAAPAW